MMTSQGGNKPSWTEIGRSTTSPTEQRQRKTVKVDDYYVVVGFEVNNPKAFADDTQDLAVDYGHAFFYVVKNSIVEAVFSFGPNGGGKVGWFDMGDASQPNAYDTGAVLKNGYQNARPGTPYYHITEKVSAFKVPITAAQASRLKSITETFIERIESGKEKYTAYMNDTCAESARDLLNGAGISTPSGSGLVKHSGMGIATGKHVDVPKMGRYRIGFTAVNPYMWHKNFSSDKKYEHKSEVLDEANPKKLIGRTDPLF